MPTSNPDTASAVVLQPDIPDISPSPPVVKTLDAAWKQQTGTIKIAWGQLAEHQLLKAEGQEQKLAVLRLHAESGQLPDQIIPS